MGFGLATQALQELIGRAQMAHGHRPRFAIDPARLDETVVGRASDFDLSECSPLFVYT